MEIKNVGVLGCGLMGAGIAQVAAASGFKTIVREVNQGALDKGMARIKRFLDDGVSKGKVTTEQRDTTLANLTGTTQFAAMKDCDIIVEAILENVDEKVAAYTFLEAGVSPNTIFALHHRARGEDEAARSLWRAALFQSSPADEAGRGRSGAHDE